MSENVDELGRPLHPLEIEGRRTLALEFRELARPAAQPLPSGVLYRDKRAPRPQTDRSP